jgi:hypothetical protein
MANRKDAQTLVVVGALSVIVASVGLFLGFSTGPRQATGPETPAAPDQGPILYGMRSVRSDPDRVRLEWNDSPGAAGYRITLMTAEDESLLTSPTLRTTSWTLPSEVRSRLERQTVYHWRLTVLLPGGRAAVSEPAAFATQ